MTLKIGINGCGRIGRTVLRAALKRTDLKVVHMNDLSEANTLAHLIKHDSVHGTLDVPVAVTTNGLKVGSHDISVSSMRDPAEIPWKQHQVDIVLECTGVFKTKEEAERHIKAGAKKVVISAPAKNEDLTVVFGVNDSLLKAEHTVISNGSCTTNCLAPVAKVIQDNWGIEGGVMTTIHAYTNDQKILDLPHSDLRRARAAGVNMIPTSTGAAKAISLVIPALSGKLQGMAVRVPTPNVSLVDLTVTLNKDATTEEVNAKLKTAAEGNLKGVLAYSDEPLVSIDYNGNPNSSIVDGLSTMMVGPRMLKVLSWYDNESGFSHRMLDVAAKIAKLS